MRLELYFSKEEIEEFLICKGYKLKDIKEEVEVHIHGSRFITKVQTERIAIKDKKEYRIDEAFKKEIKTKLLTDN